MLAFFLNTMMRKLEESTALRDILSITWPCGWGVKIYLMAISPFKTCPRIFISTVTVQLPCEGWTLGQQILGLPKATRATSQGCSWAGPGSASCASQTIHTSHAAGASCASCAGAGLSTLTGQKRSAASQISQLPLLASARTYQRGYIKVEMCILGVF